MRDCEQREVSLQLTFVKLSLVLLLLCVCVLFCECSDSVGPALRALSIGVNLGGTEQPAMVSSRCCGH